MVCEVRAAQLSWPAAQTYSHWHRSNQTNDAKQQTVKERESKRKCCNFTRLEMTFVDMREISCCFCCQALFTQDAELFEKMHLVLVVFQCSHGTPRSLDLQVGCKSASTSCVKCVTFSFEGRSKQDPSPSSPTSPTPPTGQRPGQVRKCDRAAFAPTKWTCPFTTSPARSPFLLSRGTPAVWVTG